MQLPVLLSQEEKESLLTERELREYRIYMRLKQPPMAPSAEGEFFRLFLNGVNCEEIHRLNPNGFSLGAIVRARIEFDWDQKRREHQEQLSLRIRDRVMQVQLETTERVANELAASNKAINERVLRYIQTGDDKALEGTGIGTLKHLKETVELLLKLTGQDGDKKTEQKVTGTVQHVHSAAPTEPQVPVLPVGKPLLPAQAAGALEFLQKKRQGQN